MTVLGLIGKIGAGKTTVANLFRQHGAVAIDADALTHDALKDQRVQEPVSYTHLTLPTNREV